MNSESPNYTDRKIALQRAALLWEDVWRRIQRPLMVIGVAIVVIASGMLDWFPKWFDLVVFGLVALAFLYSLKDLAKLKSASRLAKPRVRTYTYASTFGRTIGPLRLRCMLGARSDPLQTSTNRVQVTLLAWPALKRTDVSEGIPR